MLKIIMFVIGFSFMAEASTIKRGTRYQSYDVKIDAGKSVKFVIWKTVKTDNCNTYGIETDVNAVAKEDGAYVNTWVVQYSVYQTEMACEPPRPPKWERLVSEVETLSAPANESRELTLLVPSNVGIRFTY